MIGKFEAFTSLISVIFHCWTKIAAAEMKAYDLKAAYAFYIITLYRHPEGLTAANLCEICRKDKAEISRSVSVMEKRGIVRKENTANNAYRAAIFLTDEGRKAAKQMEERAVVAVEAGGKGLTDEELDVFYHALGVISENMKKISREGLPK